MIKDFLHNEISKAYTVSTPSKENENVNDEVDKVTNTIVSEKTDCDVVGNPISKELA